MPKWVRILIVVLLCSVMAIIGIYSYRSTSNYKKATGWVNHSQEVMAGANSLLSGIQDIETAQRGYVITGEPEYLTPYTTGLADINRSYALLQNLVEDNPPQEVMLDSIYKLTTAKEKFVEKVINARSEYGFEASQTLVVSAEGEKLTQQLKTLTRRFIQNERDLLDERLNKATKEYTWAVIFIVLSVIVTIAIILLAYYSLNKDYKRRLATEARLRERELLTKKFLNNIPLGVFILDREGKAYYINDKATEIMGHGIVQGTRPADVYEIVMEGTNQRYPAEKLPLARALKGEFSRVEDTVVARGNTRIPIRINAAPVTNAAGEIEYAIAIFEDITDIREANNKIRESEEKFFKAFAISPVAFAISDMETGRYMEVNDSFVKITGYSREEILGKSSVEIGIVVDTETREKILNNIRQHGSVRNAEISLRNKNGQIVDMLTSAETLILKGKKCTLSINYDITALKESERKLIEANKLAEESVSLREAFLANMSHEIRTPMNAIVGFTELLLKKDLDAENRDYVETIKTSGENLLRIINDILDISKIESGLMLFEENPISIKELFSSLKNMMLPKAMEKRLELSFDYSPDIPDTVLGDPTRLTQIIINLVGNALKFTKEGSVTMSARVLKEETGKYIIEFSVKDTGVGIAEEKIQYVFERFRQAESYTTRHYGGTGLGLSIAKQLIELQGGKIYVKSVEGVGSEFAFTLPFKKMESAGRKSTKTASEVNMKELSKLNILMAEDNLINIKFIQSLFKDYHIHADIAKNGKEAIEKFVQKNYDLVLMDIEMPEMNGYETTSIIRKKFKSNVPIIAMTANAMAGEREKCLKQGMSDYISKPLDSETLFEKMYNAAFSGQTENEEKKCVNMGFLITSMNGKKEEIQETIDIFLEYMPKDMALLQQAVDSRNYSAVKQYAHKIKSSVSLMGIAKMESILVEMEGIAVSDNDRDKLKELYRKLEKINAQAIKEIEGERAKFV